MGERAEEVTIAVLDLETTGLSATKDRIIQIAVLTLNHEVKPLKLYESYFNPGQDVELSKSYHIHQISSDVLKNSPLFESKADEILDVLRGVDVIVGHNVVFDFEFLRNEFHRIDLDTVTGESESDENWQNVKKLNTTECLSTKAKVFDTLKFKLLDTFRLALVALPNQRSYSLSALSRNLGIQVKMFQVTGYKWGSKNDSSENVFDACEKVTNMREHNAITDVLQTEQLLKRCLRILNIGYTDILDGKCQKFEIDKQLILTANTLLEKKMPTKDELIELVMLAPYQMNINFPERSQCLIDMNVADINEVINFLSTRQSLSDRRQKLICHGFVKLLLDEERFRSVEDPVSSKRQKDKCDESNQQKDGCKNKESSEMEVEKQCRLLNRGGADIPNKVARYDEKVEANVNRSTGFVASSYEDETEEYEIPEKHQESTSLTKELYGNCDVLPLTKDCSIQLEKLQQEVIQMSDTEGSWSESILKQSHGGQHGSQEYPMVKGDRITPEKDSKQEEKINSMRMFSPTF